MRQIYIYAWCFFTLFVCACSDSTTQRDDAYNLDEEALTQLAGEAFTFAYPLMEQYRMLLGLTNPQSPAFAAELNELDVIRALSGPESTQVIRPNADTLYGRLPLLLGADASMHNYVLHFTADQLPKAKGFWSLTMYNEAQLMYVNEIDRYVVGDRSAHLKYGEDGSLTIYLQHENPGADKERNWLPTNDGPFTLTMRM